MREHDCVIDRIAFDKWAVGLFDDAGMVVRITFDGRTVRAFATGTRDGMRPSTPPPSPGGMVALAVSAAPS
ncbi:hypothetical protein F8568_044345 [Actinomadura sp. LD22]|uniref:Uncharacterized protein n=1 Tax=Actinomadura physcomitrii TaxID=2650748 RepID=A0A6I4MM19_9ACTN|nr:hypothetical protein [Actinomadura physcomitrii]MWA07248.1 hypothetical protein [Actinomadura physcomitrii]